MSVLSECNLEVAKFWAKNILPKNLREKFVREIVKGEIPKKLPEIDRILELEEMIEA